MKNKEYYWGK